MSSPLESGHLERLVKQGRQHRALSPPRQWFISLEWERLSSRRLAFLSRVAAVNAGLNERSIAFSCTVHLPSLLGYRTIRCLARDPVTRPATIGACSGASEFSAGTWLKTIVGADVTDGERQALSARIRIVLRRCKDVEPTFHRYLSRGRQTSDSATEERRRTELSSAVACGQN
jgi:hypothetical protein